MRRLIEKDVKYMDFFIFFFNWEDDSLTSL